MNRDLDKRLDKYAKLEFDDDLTTLERDVNRRLRHRLGTRPRRASWLQACFGVPAYVGAPAMALTLMLGIYLGLDAAKTGPLMYRDALGLEVLTTANDMLPSRLLEAEQ